MLSLPVTDEPFGRMKIRFLMKEKDAVGRIDDLAFYAQNTISSEFDIIPFRDLGSESPSETVERVVGFLLEPNVAQLARLEFIGVAEVVVAIGSVVFPGSQCTQRFDFDLTSQLLVSIVQPF